MAEQEQNLPYDLEAEQAVLGAILYDNDVLSHILGHLEASSFYDIKHKNIFRAMLELQDSGQPIDEILIGEQLKITGDLETSGGYLYLNELIDIVPHVENIESYVKLVHDKSLLRELVATTQKIAKSSTTYGADVANLIADAEDLFNNLALRSKMKSYSSIREILPESFARLEKNSKNKNEVIGVPSGFHDLDKMTAGFQNSDLIILAARPSMGKTALALNMASFVAKQTDIQGAVLIFSLEMSMEQLTIRLMSSEAKIDSKKMRNGNLVGDDWTRLAKAAERLSTMPLYLCDVPSPNVYEISAVCKQLSSESPHGVSLIVIDYLQLVQGNSNANSREIEVSQISRALKKLARELNVPVIALSQLNRSLESRSDKRPQLSDLRESGALEQDADLILFIYRDEVYNKETTEQGIAEILISKHRNGPTGMRKLVFDGKYTSFFNLAQGADVPDFIEQ